LHIPPQILPPFVLIGSAVLLLAALGLAVFRAQWMALRAEPGRVHLVAGGALCCLLLWLMNIHFADGLRLHFLGVTTLSLLVGWSFSLLAGTTALVGFYLLQGMDWSGFALSAVLTVLLPASASRALAAALYRPQLRHPFIYFLGAGFAGGGLVVVLLGMLALGLFALAGLDERVDAMLQNWPLLFLMMFSEGFINGMCVSALAVFYPHWMKTFDDRFYLDDE
jgi:uncharacterized membrane protein